MSETVEEYQSIIRQSANEIKRIDRRIQAVKNDFTLQNITSWPTLVMCYFTMLSCKRGCHELIKLSRERITQIEYDGLCYNKKT